MIGPMMGMMNPGMMGHGIQPKSDAIQYIEVDRTRNIPKF